jgi:hypothetical protein
MIPGSHIKRFPNAQLIDDHRILLQLRLPKKLLNDLKRALLLEEVKKPVGIK